MEHPQKQASTQPINSRSSAENSSADGIGMTAVTPIQRMSGTTGAAVVDSRPPAGRFVLPAVGPPENAPVQLMEKDKIKSGRWYIVQVGEKQYTLYLKSMRYIGEYDFYDKERGGVLILTVKDNNDILEFASGPGTDNQQGNDMTGGKGTHDDADKMQDIAGGEGEKGNEGENDHIDGIQAKAGDNGQWTDGSMAADDGAERLGIVSWNVAHFSDRDVEAALETFVKAFGDFDVASWDKLFKHLDDFIAGVQEVLDKFRTTKKKPEDEKYKEMRVMRRLSEGRGGDKRKVNLPKHLKEKPFMDSDELKGEDNDLFDRLQGDSSDKLQKLDESIKKLAAELAGYDRGKLKAEIKEIAGVDWKELWKHAKSDSGKRMELAVKVKNLRAFKTSAESTDALLKQVSALMTNNAIRVFLQRAVSTAYSALQQDELNAAPAMQAVLELDRSMHTHNILIHIEEMFAYNGWLDIVILQEINNPQLLGKDKTPGAAGGGTNDEHPDYDTYLGPQLLSAGDTPQQEYYPLLIRKSSGMEVKKVYQVSTKGAMVEAPPTINWDKGAGIYRPIIVYEVMRTGMRKPFWIGVVHTTPEADTDKRVAEWNRKLIFEEVSEGLTTLRRVAGARGIPLIVGGDYYLTAEAVVADEVISDSEEEWEGSEEIDQGILGLQQEQDLNDNNEIASYRKVIEARIRGLLQARKKLLREVKDISEEDPRLKKLNKLIRINEEAYQDKQLHRNVKGLTVASQVEDMGLNLAQTVSGTNPKSDPLTEREDVQIADFFIHNDMWKSSQTGLLRPEGKMVSVDTEDMTYSKYWQRFSDHFPVAAIFSLEHEDLSQHEALVTPSGSQESADKININRYAHYEEKNKQLAWVEKMLGTAVPDQTDVLRAFNAIIGIAEPILSGLDEKTKYDYSPPEGIWATIKRIEYFKNRTAETMGTGRISTYEPEQINEMAMAYLTKRLAALQKQYSEESPDEVEDGKIGLFGMAASDLHNLINKICVLEGILGLDEAERLHVTRPEDFQPAFSAEDLVKKMKTYIAKPFTSSEKYRVSGSYFGTQPRTVMIGQHTWTVNHTNGAGNCFYNGIFEGLYGVKADNDAQQMIRERVVHMLLTNQQVITHLFGVVPKLADVNAVVEQIIQEGNWTDDFTPSFVAEALNLKIIVLRPNGTVYYIASPTVPGPQTHQVYLQYNGAHFDSITQRALNLPVVVADADMEVSKPGEF